MKQPHGRKLPTDLIVKIKTLAHTRVLVRCGVRRKPDNQTMGRQTSKLSFKIKIKLINWITPYLIDTRINKHIKYGNSYPTSNNISNGQPDKMTHKQKE
jgi:hypothetical protein